MAKPRNTGAFRTYWSMFDPLARRSGSSPAEEKQACVNSVNIWQFTAANYMCSLLYKEVQESGTVATGPSLLHFPR